MCINGDIQLVDQEYEHTGRVEICVSGEWQSLCVNSIPEWTEQEAQVVCRQLGYKNFEGMVHIHQYGSRVWFIL